MNQKLTILICHCIAYLFLTPCGLFAADLATDSDFAEIGIPEGCHVNFVEDTPLTFNSASYFFVNSHWFDACSPHALRPACPVKFISKFKVDR